MMYSSIKIVLCLVQLGLISFGSSAFLISDGHGRQQVIRASSSASTTNFLSAPSKPNIIDDEEDSLLSGGFEDATCTLSPSAPLSSSSQQRRSLLVKSLQTMGAAAAVTMFGSSNNANAAEVDDFASIAALASKISQDMLNDAQEDDDEDVPPPTATSTSSASNEGKTAYDFTLPVGGKSIPFRQLVTVNPDAPPKAIIVVNIKQDDPLARKNIPELITLAAKYGRNGDFVVVACPTDQGYFEADTSTLVRLKLASEYGYGINPATTLTDKVNLLGKSAHPFWRWLEGTCRTPAGLGRVEGNYEKFLLDGKTGLPLRRYPRKYMPLDMQDDIDAVLESRPLPPASANWKEEWRVAAAEAERDTYRFQKGINVF